MKQYIVDIINGENLLVTAYFFYAATCYLAAYNNILWVIAAMLTLTYVGGIAQKYLEPKLYDFFDWATEHGIPIVF